MTDRPERVVLVVGTGTEVGKTWVACGLARALRGRGLIVAARKPAQSYDSDDDLSATDAALLAHATGEHPVAVCPQHRWYPVAMAPPIAAEVRGRRAFTIADHLEKACTIPVFMRDRTFWYSDPEALLAGAAQALDAKRQLGRRIDRDWSYVDANLGEVLFHAVRDVPDRPVRRAPPAHRATRRWR